MSLLDGHWYLIYNFGAISGMAGTALSEYT
jgi:hypothetical protein